MSKSVKRNSSAVLIVKYYVFNIADALYAGQRDDVSHALGVSK